jgi:hypothetical protein
VSFLPCLWDLQKTSKRRNVQNAAFPKKGKKKADLTNPRALGCGPGRKLGSVVASGYRQMQIVAMKTN